jgi:hypothetical protein
MSFDHRIRSLKPVKNKGVGYLSFGFLLPGLILPVVAFFPFFGRVGFAWGGERPADLFPGRFLAPVDLMRHIMGMVPFFKSSFSLGGRGSRDRLRKTWPFPFFVS